MQTAGKALRRISSNVKRTWATFGHSLYTHAALEQKGRRSQRSLRFLSLLTRQLLDAITPRRQLGILDDQHGKTVLDFEVHLTAWTEQFVAIGNKVRVAGIHGAAEDFEELGINHVNIGFATWCSGD